MYVSLLTLCWRRQISVERGTSYAEAMRVWHEHSAENDGFYVTTDEKNGRRGAILAVQLQGKRNKATPTFNIYKPNSGLQSRAESLKTIKSKYRKVRVVAAPRHSGSRLVTSLTFIVHVVDVRVFFEDFFTSIRTNSFWCWFELAAVYVRYISSA